jgi:hypothetical protein
MTFPDSKILWGVLIYIVCNVAGDLMLSHGMRQMGPVAGGHPAGLLHLLQHVVTTPPVLMGTALQAVGFGTFLGLLSEADLSLVVPAGAGTYVLIALLSRWVLHETVPPQRWMGVLLVTVGVALVLSCRDTRSAATADCDPAGTVAMTADTEAYSPRPLSGQPAE